MTTDHDIRHHLRTLLQGKGAHLDFEKVLRHLPEEMRGKRPAKDIHSPWELLEHLRISQWDILEFSRNPDHESPEWPEGYWPAQPAPPDGEAWNKSVVAYLQDLRDMEALVTDEKADLFTPLPHGDGQTLLREALVLADHNSYHLGQMVLVRKLLGCWPAA